MIRSMTGFGQAEHTAGGYKIYIELRSVNHRYLEAAFRMPREWSFLEDSLKKRIQASVKRGRVDVFITMDRENPGGAEVNIDWSLADGYVRAAAQLKQRYALSDDITLANLLSIPELLIFGETGDDRTEEARAGLLACLGEALGHLVGMREAEGAHLQSELLSRMEVLEKNHSSLQQMAAQAVTEYAEKLRGRVQELLSGIPVDDDRLAMEVILFADKSNVDEELTRLESHFEQFRRMLNSPEPVGRKLDFLIQEMNREVNTVGSKANHAGMGACVVHMKAELEKIREQVQNIE